MKTEMKTELRPGIGLCDDCGEPRWPQVYVGLGIMLCLDCIEKEAGEKSLIKILENESSEA